MPAPSPLISAIKNLSESLAQIHAELQRLATLKGQRTAETSGRLLEITRWGPVSPASVDADVRQDA